MQMPWHIDTYYKGLLERERERENDLATMKETVHHYREDSTCIKQ